MPHSPRIIDPSGGLYHATTRGNNKSFVLAEDSDKEFFKRIIARCKRERPFKLYHYSIMGNHYHLNLEPLVGISLAEIMKDLNHRYSLYRKRRYNFSGQLWQGRFHSELIDTDAYLLTCGIYIELNPVRAGIVKNPEEYQWSSYRRYAYGEADPLVDLDPLYETLGRTAEERERTYRTLTSMWMSYRK